MPGDPAADLESALRRALGLDAGPAEPGRPATDDAAAVRRRAIALAHVAAASKALEEGRAELAALVCLAAFPEGEPGGQAEELLRQAFAATRCLRVAPDAHPGGAQSVAWTPDASMILSGGTDGAVFLWSAADLARVGRLAGHEAAVRRIELNPVWPVASTCGDDGAAILWDMAGRRDIWRVQGRDASALAARFSPDGAQVAVAGGVEWSGLRAARTGELLFSFRGHDGVVIYDAAFSPDGRRLATCGDDGRAIVWDVSRREATAVVVRERPMRTVAFDRAGGRLACACYDGTVTVLRLTDGARHVLDAGRGRARAAFFVDDGADLWIVYDGGAQTIVRNVGEPGQTELSLPPGSSQVLSAGVRRDGRALATTDRDGACRIATLTAHRLDRLVTLWSPGGALVDVDVSGDGARAATAGADGAVAVWSLGGGDAQRRLALEGPALWEAARAWRAQSRRALSPRELERLGLDEGLLGAG